MQRRFDEKAARYVGLSRKHQGALGLDQDTAAAPVESGAAPSLNTSFDRKFTTINVASRNPMC
jgi:hypothetical protein